jgi:cell division septum initiation protein DivIVA
MRSGESPPRFPITRHGYDRAIVDQRFAELEQEIIELDRELADLQGSTPRTSEATGEIDRLGEQISAILIAAHESAAETTRLAEAEADRCIADAESRARGLSEAANRELEGLQGELTSLRQERDRLLDEIRSIADRFRALADNPAQDARAEPGGEHPDTAHP